MPGTTGTLWACNRSAAGQADVECQAQVHLRQGGADVKALSTMTCIHNLEGLWRSGQSNGICTGLQAFRWLETSRATVRRILFS